MLILIRPAAREDKLSHVLGAVKLIVETMEKEAAK